MRPIAVEARRSAPCYSQSMDSARRSHIDRLLCLLVTASGWALNWPLMKMLLQEWPPLFARGLAGTLAAVILAVLGALPADSR